MTIYNRVVGHKMYIVKCKNIKTRHTTGYVCITSMASGGDEKLKKYRKV